MLTTGSRDHTRRARVYPFLIVPTLVALGLIATPSVRADAPPPSHLKRVISKAVFTGLAKAKGYTLVLVEYSGPRAPGCRLVSEGKALGVISYRWFSVRVLAVKGKLDTLDKEACKKLAADKRLPRSAQIDITSTIDKNIPARSVHTVYRVQGVSGQEVKLAKPVNRYLDAKGKPLTQAQLKSSCAVSNSARPNGLALMLLLVLGLALPRRRGSSAPLVD